MHLIVTRTFPPEVGGMQNLMYGLAKSLAENVMIKVFADQYPCLLYTSPSPRDCRLSRMPSSA